MKTQRRHELQTNQLADRIGVYIQKVRPYQKPILYGLATVAVLGGAVLYLSSLQQAKAGASWEDYFGAMVEQQPEALAEVARLHSGSTAALWARQAAGDMKLSTGAMLLFRDRNEARKNLKDAEKEFLAVEQDGARYPMLLQRARYGLAQVYESLCEVDKARDYYKKVASAEPDSALGQLAQRRHDEIAGQDPERWFAWFEKQVPKTPVAPVSATGQEPSTPFDLEAPAETPDLPSLGGDMKPAPAPDAQPEAAPEAQPATEPAAKPAAEPEATPAPQPEEKPAPATEAKPVAEPEAKPAAEPEAAPAPQPEEKPAPAPEAKPVAEPEAKPAAEPETPPAPQPEEKPAPAAEAKPAPEPVPDAKPAEAAPSPAEQPKS
jgi:hypothetical protein